ncbi:LpxL/LpxP family Kdo(2)-lipid IV(A) lauroyl/palmitoleoyl acyltransferase [Sediminicurvatus halobius]|uniref:Lipid A biosynthesis acyltransferase n=1 Tax=Sediminicurvatus halobius TaxID=2182432 RepID=A0A2U2N6T3_9GAMM|nr:LpxL/LpxP family Kdo(2)-lipid IV(A) lauroyl/palmitoleoyl acyltransferase [Spiribacter halobius]PWG64896.1 lipid A biosynthesis lauroyl acyltransferase [Spiribacter halobius]UEX78249.1 LpxL/LpxP family Kdo(2)-lipid IV(A) lauroyl/palmitoleoyl acyltransferase [Spiribacter halobius]
MSDSAAQGLYAPRYWPTWLAMGVLWLTSRLPQGTAMRLGDAIGALGYRLMRYRRHIAEVNLRLCFPELGENERLALLRRHFRYLGRGLIEVGIAWWGSDERIRRCGRVEGIEHLDGLQREGRPVLAVGPHFTALDIGARIVSAHLPVSIIYREHRNPVIEHFMRRSRERHVEQAFDRRDMRALLRALKDGRTVWYPPDQDFGRRHAVFAPYFGVPAATITLPARLARQTRAYVVPAFLLAEESGDGYVVHIGKPLENFPSGDDVADATRINALMEAEIRRHPAQYYWVHRRFKTRPPGEAPPYELRRRRRRSKR